jgi:hypothetical protein
MRVRGRGTLTLGHAPTLALAAVLGQVGQVPLEKRYRHRFIISKERTRSENYHRLLMLTPVGWIVDGECPGHGPSGEPGMGRSPCMGTSMAAY